jgi:CDP-diacylglycerol--glycerol-3-phosphate 3-phosphatidyltransferase
MSGATAERRGVERDVALVVAGLGVGLVAVAAGVATFVDGTVAVRWALPAVSVVAFELWFLLRHLDANHVEGDEPDVRYARLGIPNVVTLVRGGLFAGVAGFAAVDPVPTLAWLPAALYGAGCALDAVDGALARRNGRVTVLGARLDLAFDTLGFLVAPVVAVLWGRLPVWYLSLALARYLFRAGQGFRRLRGLPVYDLPESRVRRPLAGMQMAFITLALAPVLPTSVVRPLAAVVLAPSLLVFARDYLVVAGHLNPESGA